MGQEAPLAGRVLNGRYRLEEKLGEGGMGQIWRAQHLILKAPVAVKLVDRQATPNDETFDRFIREAQAAAAIRSPHVVQILDYGTDDKLPFMVMELLDGETLAQRLRKEKRLSAQETAKVIAHIGRAVGRAHEEGIVHRDLKPENVFLVNNDDEEVAKVLDFGVAKIESANLGEEGTRTRTGSILGTPYYMSPEQAQGNKAVDFRSDLWSVAVIAFECLTGKRPFYSDGLGDLVLAICIREIPVPSRVAPVPLGFDGWFKKGTDRDPDRRFQSARELVESLRDVLGIEGRETWATPDVLITTGNSDPPLSGQPTARSEALTELAGPEVLPQPRLSVAAVDTTPSAPASTAAPVASRSAPRRRSLQDDELSAESLALRFRDDSHDDRAPALTVQQFGTTKHSLPPPPVRSSAGLVWGVAGMALAIGAVIGFAVVSRGESGESSAEPLSPGPPEQPSAEVSTEPRRSDTPEVAPSATSSAAQGLAPAGSASVSAPLDNTAPADAGVPTANGAASANPADAGSQAADADTDAGWVKPDWARPDDEEAPDPPEPPPTEGAEKAGDNPY
jgi:serine/threonine-protein kinase